MSSKIDTELRDLVADCVDALNKAAAKIFKRFLTGNRRVQQDDQLLTTLITASLIRFHGDYIRQVLSDPEVKLKQTHLEDVIMALRRVVRGKKDVH